MYVTKFLDTYRIEDVAVLVAFWTDLCRAHRKSKLKLIVDKKSHFLEL